MRRSLTLALAAAVVATPLPCLAQEVPLRFKQERDSNPVQALSAAEFATLGDPLFNLVLKTRADVTRVADVEKLIQPDIAKRATFVVDERIASSAKPSSRRAVLTFEGATGGENLSGNVMLSITFSSASFPDEVDAIEAWGWDNHRGRYNYYKLDNTGTPDGKLLWRLRGSSDRADLLRPAERKGTCFACHINGAPVMKELFRPWNNWHSLDFTAAYLKAGSGDPSLWPAAGVERLRRTLRQAENLEANFMVAAIRRFNGSRINQAVKRRDDTGDRAVTPDGLQTILEGRRLLRPLFETTEFNLISSRDKSGSHPLGPATDFLPDKQIRWPGTLFLNAPLLAGGGPANYNGLKIVEALQFQNLPGLSQQENRDLLADLKVQLAGAQPGDANFALFVPEPSHIDNDAADQLLRQGIVTPHFLAALLAVDLQTPVLSARRSELLRFVPEQFDYRPVPAGTDPTTLPRVADDDRLTKAVIQAIEATNPPAESSAAEFRDLLKAPNAPEALRGKVTEYLNAVKDRLSGPGRKAELQRLYKSAIDVRKAVLRDPTLRSLDETGGQLLLPVPAN